MALLRKLFWIVIFLVSTLAFVVLFEKGTDNFSENFVKQAQDLKEFVQKQVERQTGEKKKETQG